MVLNRDRLGVRMRVGVGVEVDVRVGVRVGPIRVHLSLRRMLPGCVCP